MIAPIFADMTQPLKMDDLKEAEDNIITLLKSDRRNCLLCGIRLWADLRNQKHFGGCALTTLRRMILRFEIEAAQATKKKARRKS